MSPAASSAARRVPNLPSAARTVGNVPGGRDEYAVDDLQHPVGALHVADDQLPAVDGEDVPVDVGPDGRPGQGGDELLVVEVEGGAHGPEDGVVLEDLPQLDRVLEAGLRLRGEPGERLLGRGEEGQLEESWKQKSYGVLKNI